MEERTSQTNPPPVSSAALQSPTSLQPDQKLDPAALTEIDSGCGLIHFRCGCCDKPIKVGEEWAGSRFKCPTCGDTSKIPNSLYDQVPFYRKQGFFWIMYFLVTPVAIAILLFGDVYYQKKGKVKSFGLANRIVAGVIAAFILFRIVSAFFK